MARGAWPSVWTGCQWLVEWGVRVVKALGVDVIGFTLIDVPPFDVVHLMLTDEPTVLYGANSAGKTRLLCTIRDALAGVPTAGPFSSMRKSTSNSNGLNLNLGP